MVRLPFSERRWRCIVTWNLNMFTLITIGTGTAYLFSFTAVPFLRLIPESFRHHGQVLELGKGPEPPFESCYRWPLQRPGSFVTVKNEKSRSKKSTRETPCVTAPVRKSLWMARSRVARA